MARVRLEINNRAYEMITEDGEERRVMQLGEDIGKRVKNIAHQVGQVGEGRILLMAALQLADEQRLLKEKLTELEHMSSNQVADQSARDEAQADLSQAYADMAERLESLISSLN